MDILKSLFEFMQKLLEWYYIVQPWQQAIHLRKGKCIHLRCAGIYLKIPFVDMVFCQTIRLRTVDLPIQTITTKDNTAYSIKTMMQYRIADMYKMYNTIAHPELTLQGIAQGAIGGYITQKWAAEINIHELEKMMSESIKAGEWGLCDVSIKITTFAAVRTYRIIQDDSRAWEGLNMDQLLGTTNGPK